MFLLFSIFIFSAIVSHNAVFCTYDPSNIHFTLYNTLHPYGTTTLTPNNIPPNTPVIVIIHGWSEVSTAQWLTDLRNAYLIKEPTNNVIIVDYSQYSQRAYLETLRVAARIGGTIGDKIAELGVNGARVKCVGFSLGAQLCGFAGRVMKRLGTRVGGIVGLDAAGPGFDRPLFKTLPKLRSGDAQVVLGYYTSGSDFGFGVLTRQPYADYNIMINGGSFQPGCSSVTCNHIFARRIKLLSQLSASATVDYQVTLCSTYEEYLQGRCSSTSPVPLSSLDKGLAAHGNYYFRTDKDFNQRF